MVADSSDEAMDRSWWPVVKRNAGHLRRRKFREVDLADTTDCCGCRALVVNRSDRCIRHAIYDASWRVEPGMLPIASLSVDLNAVSDVMYNPGSSNHNDCGECSQICRIVVRCHSFSEEAGAKHLEAVY